MYVIQSVRRSLLHCGADSDRYVTIGAVCAFVDMVFGLDKSPSPVCLLGPCVNAPCCALYSAAYLGAACLSSLPNLP